MLRFRPQTRLLAVRPARGHNNKVLHSVLLLHRDPIRRVGSDEHPLDLWWPQFTGPQTERPRREVIRVALPDSPRAVLVTECDSEVHRAERDLSIPRALVVGRLFVLVPLQHHAGRYGCLVLQQQLQARCVAEHDGQVRWQQRQGRPASDTDAATATPCAGVGPRVC
ncbi:hypothetical protein BX600DRAFT_447419 [Xylariales sp. PMI_506]|nr:hypothetical protein BX600DRAFT_447419 [Xylariales sp. PMI_506]